MIKNCVISYINLLVRQQLIQSWYSLSCNRSIASSRASSLVGMIWSFFFSNSSTLLFPWGHLLATNLLLPHLVSSIPPSVMCFRRQSLSRMWPIRSLSVLLCIGCSLLPWLYVILFHMIKLIFSILPQHQTAKLSRYYLFFKCPGKTLIATQKLYTCCCTEQLTVFVFPHPPFLHVLHWTLED